MKPAKQGEDIAKLKQIYRKIHMMTNVKILNKM